MRSFASDNNSGVHPLVMDAVIKANDNHAVGYGDDPWTAAATAKIKEVFGEMASPFFVFNGTGANTVALQAVTRPFNSILCAETAHINVDECGAPARMTGCAIVTIPAPDGKLYGRTWRPGFEVRSVFGGQRKPHTEIAVQEDAAERSRGAALLQCKPLFHADEQLLNKGCQRDAAFFEIGYHLIVNVHPSGRRSRDKSGGEQHGVCAPVFCAARIFVLDGRVCSPFCEIRNGKHTAI